MDWKGDVERLRHYEQSWPYPLATACRNYRLKTSLNESARAGTHLLELILRHLVYLAIAEYRSLEQRAETIDEHLLKEAFMGKPVAGNLARTLRLLMPFLQKSQAALLEPALPAVYFHEGSYLDQKLLSPLIEHRNSIIHPNEDLSPHEQTEAYEAFHDLLDALLARLEFLSDSQLVYVSGLQQSGGKSVLIANLLTGCYSSFEEQRLPADQGYDTELIGIYKPQSQRFLSLSPMYVVEHRNDTQISLANLVQIKSQKLKWQPGMRPLSDKSTEEILFHPQGGIRYEPLPKAGGAAVKARSAATPFTPPVQAPIPAAPKRTGSKGLLLVTCLGMLVLLGGGIGAWRAGWIGQRAFSNDPSELIKQGYLAFQKHDYAQAIALYNRCLELDPDYPAAYNNRALVYQAQEKWDAALEDSNKAIALDTGYAVAYSTRGWSYHHKGQTQRGLDDLETSIKLRADSRWPWFYRAEIHKASGNCPQAQKDYQEACSRGHQEACKQTCP